MKNTLLLITLLISGTAFSQTVETFAGKSNSDALANFEASSGVDLTSSYFSFPSGICFDHNGKMYIGERNKLRIVQSDKLYIRTGKLASPAFSEGYKNGTGTQAWFRNPGGMVSDANGNIFVADIDNHCIRKVAPYVNLGNGQVVTTFAGANPNGSLNGTSGSANGTGTNARFNKPTDIAMDASGNMYVTEYDNFTIRKITPAGAVTTLAGVALSEGTTDATSGGAVRFGGPWGIAMYTSNTVVVSDPWNGNIREVNIFTGSTTTLAGPTTGPDSKIVDGTLSEARFKKPKGIAVVNGLIYVADENVIRVIDESNNSVSTFAGNKANFTIKDGYGTTAQFTELNDLETDGLGNLYATENSGLVASHVIRKITIDNLVPKCEFSASKTTAAVNEPITFTDNSTGKAPTSRTWTITPENFTISDGNLTTSILQVNFTKPAFYAVSLEITNEYGTDALEKDDYISISTTGSINKYSSSTLVQLYPNPTCDKARIEVDASINTNNLKINIYHINGTLVRSSNYTNTIDVSSFANGTYFVTLTNDEVSIAKRLFVSHE